MIPNKQTKGTRTKMINSIKSIVSLISFEEVISGIAVLLQLLNLMFKKLDFYSVDFLVMFKNLHFIEITSFNQFA